MVYKLYMTCCKKSNAKLKHYLVPVFEPKPTASFALLSKDSYGDTINECSIRNQRRRLTSFSLELLLTLSPSRWPPDLLLCRHCKYCSEGKIKGTYVGLDARSNRVRGTLELVADVFGGGLLGIGLGEKGGINKRVG